MTVIPFPVPPEDPDEPEREPGTHFRPTDPWTSEASARDPVGNRWSAAKWILWNCFWRLAWTTPPDPSDPLGLAICRTDHEALYESGYNPLDDWKRRRVGTLKELGLIFTPGESEGNPHTRLDPFSNEIDRANRIGPRGVDYCCGRISWREINRIFREEQERRRRDR